jgi:hypothetical protein
VPTTVDDRELELDAGGFAEGSHWQPSMSNGDVEFVRIVFLIGQFESPASRQRHRRRRFEVESLWREFGQVGLEVPTDLDGVLVLDCAAKTLDRLEHNRELVRGAGRRKSSSVEGGRGRFRRDDGRFQSDVWSGERA